MRFGPREAWFANYYGDIGTGNSALTRQGVAGGGRQFGRLSATLGWRQVEYRFASGSALRTLRFDGPVAGASLRG